MPPQYCQGPREQVTSFMHPAPHLNEDETNIGEDRIVADPLADVTISLWNDTAKRNRETFSEIFRTVPTDRVRNWEEYSVCLSMQARENRADQCGRNTFRMSYQDTLCPTSHWNM